MVPDNRLDKIEKLGFNRKTNSSGGGWAYSFSKAARPKRGRKTVKRQTQLNIININRWTIDASKNHFKQSVNASLDQYKFLKNLDKLISTRFGNKTDAEVSFSNDCKFSVILKQRRHAAIEDLRGYGEMPYGWKNPDGIFACNIELCFSGNIFSVFVTDYFSLGYAGKDTIKNIFESIIASLGVSEYRMPQILADSSLHEIRIPVVDVISSALKAKDSERKELLEIISEFDVEASKTYYQLDKIEEDMKLHFSSRSSLDEYLWEKEFPICVLESRKASDDLKVLDQGIISGELHVDRSVFSEEKIMLERGILERFYIATFLKEQHIPAFSLDKYHKKESLLGLSYLIFVDDSGSDSSLENASKLVRKFIEIYGDVDNHKMVTVCLSELFGDLWRNNDAGKAELSYKRVLDLIGDDLRVFKKLLSLGFKTNDLSKQAKVLDSLIELEPRNTEKAKYIFQKSSIESANNNVDAHLELCRKAYTTDRQNFEIFDALLDTLIKLEKYTEFLAVTEDHVRMFKHRLGKKNYSAVLFKEAVVWNEGLARADIAYKKLLESEKLNPNLITIKIYLANVIKALGHKKVYLESLENCLEIA
ncbi:hypothetical protein N9W79_01725, partial [bacterium]|nr:hypothetical protein [bacterium]